MPSAPPRSEEGLDHRVEGVPDVRIVGDRTNEGGPARDERLHPLRDQGARVDEHAGGQPLVQAVALEVAGPLADAHEPPGKAGGNAGPVDPDLGLAPPRGPTRV